MALQETQSQAESRLVAPATAPLPQGDVFGLSGKVALITGAGSGIGRGTAIELALHGVRVGLLDQSADELRDVCQEMSMMGAECEPLVADVSDPEGVRSAVDSLVQRFERLDIVHANAGINGVWAPIEEIEPEEYDRTMSSNLKGTFLTIKYATPYIKRQGGSVLITSSVNGTRTFSNSGATVYSASKAGQVAMAKMLAVELGPHRIRVNVICPGAIHTNIDASTERRNTDDLGVKAEYPEGAAPLDGEQEGTIQQVGKLAVFLASDMADHITGEVVYIDGGSSLVV